MSVQLLSWAYAQQVGGSTRKAVLVALANRANHDTGLCCPSVKSIAKEVEVNRATVIRALHELEQRGFIQRVERRRENGSQTTNEYRFPMVGGVTMTPPPSHDATPPVAQRDPLNRKLEPEVKPNLAAAPRQKPSRQQCDEVWDTLTDIFGPALTRTAEKHRGQLVQSLAGAMLSGKGETLATGWMRGEILRRAKSWPAHFDRATLTAAALEKHWDTLGRKPLRRTG